MKKSMETTQKSMKLVKHIWHEPTTCYGHCSFITYVPNVQCCVGHYGTYIPTAYDCWPRSARRSANYLLFWFKLIALLKVLFLLLPHDAIHICIYLNHGFVQTRQLSTPRNVCGSGYSKWSGFYICCKALQNNATSNSLAFIIMRNVFFT